MPTQPVDLAILFEHPEWQKPLFEVLDARGVDYVAIDLKRGVVGGTDAIPAKVIFNQASPSAYLRGNTRAVPFGLTLLEGLEADGANVINGAPAFRFELNKAVQARLLSRLGIDYPRTLAFNDVDGLEMRAEEIGFPAMLKPNQGGSGARMHVVNDIAEIRDLLSDDATWAPDHVMLLQEYLPHDSDVDGIVRMEFVGGELLYAMRVHSDGGFNLCPSETCNPEDGSEGVCALPSAPPVSAGPRFVPFADVPAEAVAVGKQICAAGKLDVAGIEYLETGDGRRVFYDVNANSNLRRPIGLAMGFDPFERVADFLQAKIAEAS
ncbi:MAG: hypothetical protein KC502_08315 [Myxococcales bacterium]|nr:hypothetical protein [Myxococcales bacterium]